MSKVIKSYQKFNGGISDFHHENAIPDAYYFGRSIDVRSEPRHISILPRTVKESGSVVTDLIKWGDIYHPDLEVYFYGNSGNFYKRTSTRGYTLLRTINNSHGNGIAYNPEDDFFYYTSDKTIGRYGNMAATTPQFIDDFFGSQGGVPLNTNSLDLESGSSQYGYRADTASLSITGDLAIDLQIKPESLPTVGNTMTLVAKWNGSGNIRSYKFDIACVSGYFGGGGDGALTISSNTTEAPIDSACTGTSGTYSLTATNVSFATDQIILIHQTQGTGAGTWQRNKIVSYSAGTITLDVALNFSYSTGAQVRVMKQYTNITINNGFTWSAKAWDGTVGGILANLANGTGTVTGSISASAKGFAGGQNENNPAYQGNSHTGNGTRSNAANGSAGGGGTGSDGAGGGGAGHSSAGSNGTVRGGGVAGIGGGISGTADLTTMQLGSGGGGGTGVEGGDGGTGGGIVFLSIATLTVTGSIVCNGSVGGSGTGAGSGGGGGAGGSILLKAQAVTLGTGLITASGGSGGSGGSGADNGGAASAGRIHLDYYTSYTGTTNPTLDVVLDSSLVTNTSYQLRLAVSNDGTASETLARTTDLQTGIWQQVSVSWDASASQATFFLNSVSLGTSTGTLTTIHDNASEFFVGANKNDAGTATNFFDGLKDEVRVYNALRTAAQLLEGSTAQIATNTPNLQAYYKFNGDANDATANANNLTLSGSPSYSTDVPYSSPTARLDIDQTATTAGQTYTLPTTISEAATARKSFTPGKDPQKSIAVLIAAVGSGDWTLTVHDSLNTTLASKTMANASLATGYQEFVFDDVWRPLTNFTNEYHFHLTSTEVDGTVTTGTNADLETVSYRTYYQFLVEDTAWHPVTRFLNFIVFGNERYVAKYEATLYEPNKIVLGAGWRVRCFGYWQEYLAIGCMKGTNIYDYDQGRIYFWDGYSTTFNFYIDVPEGGINALLGSRGKLYIWAGYHADLLAYDGGTYARKLKELPLSTLDTYSEVYPGAVSMWKSLVRYGVAGASDSTAVQKGVYTWGSTNYRYNEILTFDYPISTGNYLNTVKVGLIMPFNQELLVAWQDNVSYGVDYVSDDNNPYPTASVEFLLEDLDIPYKEKQATQLVATFDPLESGESINVKYQNEETDSTWNTNADSPSADDITIKKIISNGRYYHMKVAVDLTTSVSTSPTLKSVVLETEQLEGEDVIG